MAKVERIRVMNLKALSALEMDLKGCTVLVTGKNNSGKSTFLRALPDRLRGIKPDVILKHNESEGYAEWELTTGERFIWSFDDRTKAGERLTFITKTASGAEVKTTITQDIMNRYFPDIFNVDAFLQGTPAKQRKTLQEISGLDFTEIDNRYKAAYDDRTFANKKLEEAKTKVKPINTSLPTEEVDVLSIQKEIGLIGQHNQKFEHVDSGVKEKQTDISKNDKKIADLQKEISKLERENKALKVDVDNGVKWLNDPKNIKKDAEYTAGLELKLEKGEETNGLIKKNNEAIQAKSDVETLTLEAKERDEDVKNIIKEKDEMIASAKLPEGFGFTDDGITYKGLPFTREQISSSGIYIAALKLASINLGEVKMLHFDASFLDKNSLAEVEAWAESEGLQLLIERPDFEGGEIKYELISEIE